MNRRALSATAVAVASLLGTVALSSCTLRIDPTADSTAIGDRISQERTITDVSAVELRSTGTLNVSVGDEPSLTVTGGQLVLEQLTTVVRGDALEIDLPGSRRNPGHLEYDLVLPALSSINLSGSGEVVGQIAGGDAVDLRIGGSGSIDLADVAGAEVTVTIDGSGRVDVRELAAQDTAVVVDGSGAVTLAGSTDNLRVSIPGSGDVRADELTALDAAVTIDGSGEALVNATGTLDASIAGSGSISYLGDPEVSRRIDGSGEIREA